MNKIAAILIFIALVFVPRAGAQSLNDTIIEEGARLYNSLRDFEEELSPGDIEEEDLDTVEAMADAVVQKLKYVAYNGTYEQKKVAYYFLTNAKYELCFTYGMKGRNKLAYEVGKIIAGAVDSFNSSYFPLNYKYEGKTYAIKYDNYAPTRNEFYTGMSEICYNLSYYDQSIVYSKKALSAPDITSWYKYIAISKLLETKKKQLQYDKEFMDYSLAFVENYMTLDTSYYTTIRKNNYKTCQDIVSLLNAAYNSNTELAKDQSYRAKMGFLFFDRRINDPQTGFELIEMALRTGYGSRDNNYLSQVAEKAVSYKRTSAGLLALNNLTRNYVSYHDYHTCYQLRTIESQYEALGEKQMAGDVGKEARNCEQAEEKARKKRERRSRSHLYAIQTYPLALIPAQGYRDFGGNLLLFGKKMGHEFSYRKVNLNRDATMDQVLSSNADNNDKRYLWSGFNAQYGMYGYLPSSSSRGNKFYMGGLLEYSKQNYTDQYSRVTAKSNSAVTYTAYKATAKRYSIFFNYGTIAYGRNSFGFVMQTFFGFGIAYQQWNPHNTYYDNKSDYDFDDVLLQNRKKSVITPTARFGIAIGLGTFKD